MMPRKTFFTVSFFLLLTFSAISARSQKKKFPNIIVILADDMGYSDIGCFGGDARTPNLDEMAGKGLKMTHFYNASRCCPTRASLLTGLFQHQAGVGDMMNTRPEPAYQGYLNRNCVTIAEALKPAGYNTFMAGKWHVGQAPENWPLKRGFDRYYGLIDGAASYFDLYPYRPGQKLTVALDDQPVTPGKGYYSTDAYTDYAMKFIQENEESRKPFFLYLAYQAPHWPLHALPGDIARYRGKFMKGWDRLREERFARMQKSGIIKPGTTLSSRDPHVRDWNTLTEEEKEQWDERMAVYAAMIDRMDQNIGRLRAKLRELGEEDNTVIMFLSDNGASSESIKGSGFLPGIIEASKRPASDPSSFTAYGFEGANVSNTPFRLFKHWEYEGGTATPFIAYGPGLVKKGLVSEQPAHIIDLMSTCLDLAHTPYPATSKGNKIKATEGLSLVPLFQGRKWKGHDALFFEHEGNRAVRQGRWKLVSQFPENKWYLYDIEADRSEKTDLSEKYPAKVMELAALYTSWAARAEVIPFEQLVNRKSDKFEN
ncbi:arylsulfatase [Pararcticibacter amylolyticus]|nr:arylsulfatase [Pararcticibacter amylolyticus]